MEFSLAKSVPYQIKVMMHPGKIASLTNIFSALSLRMVVYHHKIIAFRASLKVFKRSNLLSVIQIGRKKNCFPLHSTTLL